MKHTLLITTALLFITSAVFPQSKVNVNSLKEYGGKAFKVDDDEPYTGRVFDLNKNTGKKTLKGQYKNGLKTGKWTEWHDNGQKRDEGIYKDGEKDGKWTQWHWNGQKESERTYKDGKPDGLITWWFDNGQKREERTYKDGKRDGLHTEWYENGQKVYEITYKDGVVISGKCWDEDGNECECSRYSKYQWRGCN